MAYGLEQLNPEALAEDGDLRALAALVYHMAGQTPVAGRPPVGERAVQLLAKHADREEGFRWLWAVLGPERAADAFDSDRSRMWATVASALPERLAIPEDLREAVREFVLHPAFSSQTDDKRNMMQVELLERGDEGARAWLRSLAVEVLTGGGEHSDQLRRWGLGQLASSEDPSHREIVRQAASDCRDYKEEIDTLALIPASNRGAEETQAIVEALAQTPPNRVPEKAQRSAGELVATLPDDLVVEVIGQRWGEAAKGAVEPMRLAAAVSDSALRALLSDPRVPDPVSHELVRTVTTFPVERVSRLAPWLQSTDSERARPVLDHAQKRAQGKRADPEWARLVADMALAAEDSTAAQAAAELLGPRQLADRAAQANPPPAQLGRLAAQFADAGGEGTEALHMVASQCEAALGTFACGFLVELPADKDDFATPAARRCLSSPEAVRAFAGSSYKPVLVSCAVEQGVDACLTVLENAAEVFDHEDDDVSRLRDKLSWTTLSDEQYRSYLGILEGHLPWLVEEAEAALQSREGPEAQAVPAHHLVDLFDRVCRHGAASWVPDPDASFLRNLLRHPDLAVRRQACEWARLRDSSSEVVLALADTDPQSGISEELHTARETHAQQLAATARDSEQEWDPRIEAFKLTRKASVDTGRELARELLTVTHEDMRRAAATALRDMGPISDDIPHLEEALQQEPASEVRDLLRAALYRVQSGDAGEAIRNLYELVDLDPTAASGAEVLLPAPEQHAQFVSAVDTARRAAHESAQTFWHHLSVLADQLAEYTLVARFDAGDTNILKKPEAEAIRANQAKPDIGTLLVRQHLIEQFPWFSHVKVLHDARYGHSAPRGSTQPTHYREDDRVSAAHILRTIVEEWTESMRESARRRQS